MNMIDSAKAFLHAVLASMQSELDSQEKVRYRSRGFLTHPGRRHSGVAGDRRAARKRRNVRARSAK